jgi:hypothetical protein
LWQIGQKNIEKQAMQNVRNAAEKSSIFTCNYFLFKAMHPGWTD